MSSYPRGRGKSWQSTSSAGVRIVNFNFIVDVRQGSKRKYRFPYPRRMRGRCMSLRERKRRMGRKVRSRSFIPWICFVLVVADLFLSCSLFFSLAQKRSTR
jgi:hypothetical protein